MCFIKEINIHNVAYSNGDIYNGTNENLLSVDDEVDNMELDQVHQMESGSGAKND